MSTIVGYRLDAVHAFRVRTLRTLGYATRVTLSNGSERDPARATPYRVDVSVVPPGGPPGQVAIDAARLEPGGRTIVECEPFLGGHDAEVEVVFHLVPLSLEAGSRDGLVDLDRATLYYYLNAQDHYAEYYRPDGFAAGVLYQSGAINYDLFSKERSLIVQAPKVVVSDRVETYMSLAHGSGDPSYGESAQVSCSLVAPDGRKVSWHEELPAFTTTLQSMRRRAEALDGPLSPTLRFYSYYAVCENAALIPLTIVQDTVTGALSLEHSLPPIYYGDAVRGATRGRALGTLRRWIGPT